jgi:hypothetical protein
MAFKNRDIVNIIDNKLSNGDNALAAFEVISTQVNIREDKEEKLMGKLTTFLSRCLQKWKSCSRHRARFESKFKSWLDLPFEVKEFSQPGTPIRTSPKKKRPIVQVNLANVLFKNRDIVNIFENQLANRDNALAAFRVITSQVKISEDKEEKLMGKLTSFVSNYLNKWQRCSRHRARFEAKCASWLDLPFDVKEFTQSSAKSVGKSAKKKRPVGRPKKEFSELSDRSKRRRSKAERDANSNLIN